MLDNYQAYKLYSYGCFLVILINYDKDLFYPNYLWVLQSQPRTHTKNVKAEEQSNHFMTINCRIACSNPVSPKQRQWIDGRRSIRG